MNQTNILPFILSFCLGFALFPHRSKGQKIEVEKRISVEKMPVEVKAYLSQRYPVRERERYYEEISETGRTFEAKFRYLDSRYSIEFLPDGRWKETERQIRFKDLPATVKTAIHRSLDDAFQRYRIVRVQEQLHEGQVTGYELEIKGKSADHLGYFEGQFGISGEQRRIRTVEKRPNEFLFF